MAKDLQQMDEILPKYFLKLIKLINQLKNVKIIRKKPESIHL